MPEKQIFEIPQQLREIAEKNIEQARTAYGQLMDAMTQAMSGWISAPSEAMTSGFKAVQERAIQFAKENAEDGFMLANELTKAKDLQGVIRFRQAQELGRVVSWWRPRAARALRAEDTYPQVMAKQRSIL